MAVPNEQLPFYVVCINLNMAHYLTDTIDSLLTNLETDDKLIVIDGGSHDGSVDIIRRYDRFLEHWISEPDRGYADALVKGFSDCRGGLMCWVNSGDLLLANALRMARTYFADDDVDLIFGDDYHIDETGRILALTRANVRSLRDMSLFGKWTPLQDACFWRYSLYHKIGGINSVLRYAADYDLFLRASLAGRCVYVPAVFSAFRRHVGQTSVRFGTEYAEERERSRKAVIVGTAIPKSTQVMRELYFTFVSRVRHRLYRYVGQRRAEIGQMVSDQEAHTVR